VLLISLLIITHEQSSNTFTTKDIKMAQINLLTEDDSGKNIRLDLDDSLIKFSIGTHQKIMAFKLDDAYGTTFSDKTMKHLVNLAIKYGEDGVDQVVGMILPLVYKFVDDVELRLAYLEIVHKIKGTRESNLILRCEYYHFEFHLIGKYVESFKPLKLPIMTKEEVLNARSIKGEFVMSTLEIANTTDKLNCKGKIKHKNVIQKFKKILLGYNLDPKMFENFYIHPDNGQEHVYYLIGSYLTMDLAGSFSQNVRRRLITKIYELREINKVYSRLEIEDMGNEVDFYKRQWIAQIEENGVVTFLEAAELLTKHLNYSISRNLLFTILLETGVLFKSPIAISNAYVHMFKPIEVETNEFIGVAIRIRKEFLEDILKIVRVGVDHIRENPQNSTYAEYIDGMVIEQKCIKNDGLIRVDKFEKIKTNLKAKDILQYPNVSDIKFGL